MSSPNVESLEGRRLLAADTPLMDDVTITTTITDATPEYAHFIGLQDVDTLGSPLNRRLYAVHDGFVVMSQQGYLDVDALRVPGSNRSMGYQVLWEQREAALHGDLSPIERAGGVEAFAALTDEQLLVAAKNMSMYYRAADTGGQLATYFIGGDELQVIQTMRMTSTASAELTIAEYGRTTNYEQNVILSADVTFSGDIRPDDATLSLRGSTLWITGTPGDDVIGISRKGSRVHVNFNGKVIKYPAEKIGLFQVHGLAGDDYIEVGGRLPAAALAGGSGNDTLLGGDGNDELSGQSERDQLFGRGGRDVLVGGDDNDLLDGGANPDRLYATETDPAYMTLKPDLYPSGSLDKTIFWDGHDTLRGGGGSDFLRGGTAPDSLEGGPGNDQIWTNGAGYAYPTHGVALDFEHDLVSGGSGNDSIQVDSNSRTIVPNSGGARVDAGDGDDRISSTTRYATLRGGAGDDYIEGTSFNLLIGNAGDDVLYSYESQGSYDDTSVDGGSGFDLWRSATVYNDAFVASRDVERFEWVDD
ncbi:MAG: calcium-binding protein [Planctomycetota bacterium]